MPRRAFAPTIDVRTPEHLASLLDTIEHLQGGAHDAVDSESSDSMTKLRAWMHAQQREVLAWVSRRPSQPQARRLDAARALATLLLRAEGDVDQVVHQLARLDEPSLLVLLPHICDALVLQCGPMGAESCQAQRQRLCAFVLQLCVASQHVALHVCWYIRAMMTPMPRDGGSVSDESPRIGRRGHENRREASPAAAAAGSVGRPSDRRSNAGSGHHRRSSSGSYRTSASSDMRSMRALALMRQVEDAIRKGGGAACAGTASSYAAPSCGDGGTSTTGTAHAAAAVDVIKAAGGLLDRVEHLQRNLAMVKGMTDACGKLVTLARETRASALEAALCKMSTSAPLGSWLPVGPAACTNHAVQSVLPSEAVVISTNKHCPIILFFPVLLCADEAPPTAGRDDEWPFTTPRQASSWLPSSLSTILSPSRVEAKASPAGDVLALPMAAPAGGSVAEPVPIPAAHDVVSCARALYHSMSEDPTQSGSLSSLSRSAASLGAFGSPCALGSPGGATVGASEDEGGRLAADDSELDLGSPTREVAPSSLGGSGRPTLIPDDESVAELGGRSTLDLTPESDEAGLSRRVFGESWEGMQRRLVGLHQRSARTRPPQGYTTRIVPCLVKTGDSLLQEQFAIHLARTFQDAFDLAKLPLRLNVYTIVATAPDAGLVQLVTNSASIDSIKRAQARSSLSDIFVGLYGPRSGRRHRRALRNFVHSAAAWAVVCYLLQIKDRHNGNILLHRSGSIIHIDFGFLLSNSPGGNINFESAPFKLTGEHVALMGGVRSVHFARFRELVVKGFLAARRHSDTIVDLVQLTLEGAGRDLPCFVAGADAVDALRARFQTSLSRWQCARFIDDMINTSIDHWTTTCYDRYQRC